MAGFVLLVGLVVAVLSATLVGGDPVTAAGTGAIALLVAGAFAAWSYLRGDRAILRMSDARPVEKADDPELYNVVEEMAIAAGIPTPPVWLIEDTALNAFATGRDPEHAAVAITRGLRERLDRDELQSVIAHEIAHVRNHDIRLTMLLATLVGLVVLLCDFFWRILRARFWLGGGRGRDRSSGGGFLGLAVLAAALILAAVAPILARVIQLAASRQREYLADAGGVELTRNPEAMVDALRKLGADREVLEVANRATAHLYIVQPIKKWEERAQGVFSTHPPLEDRIRRIERLLE